MKTKIVFIRDQVTIAELEAKAQSVTEVSWPPSYSYLSFIETAAKPSVILALCARVKALEKELAKIANFPADDLAHDATPANQYWSHICAFQLIARETVKSHGSNVPLEMK